MAEATWSNWAQNLHYASRVVRPQSVEEVVACVRGADRVQMVGSGHSFIHATGPSAPLVSETPSDEYSPSGLVLLDLTQTMNRVLSVDEANWSCEVEGGCTLACIAEALERRGLALENCPSLHVVTLAGAAMTSTHGCGQHRRVIADMICSMTVVRADGEIQEISDKRFFAHLGLLGVVVRMTVRCVPFYRIHQRCYEEVSLARFLEHAPAIVLSASHTQFWIDFGQGQGADGKVLGWLRDRCGERVPSPPDEMYPGVGGKLRHDPVPIDEEPDCPIHATGEGPWHDMLAFFRLDATFPMGGTTVQTEFFVALEQLPEALTVLSQIPELESLMSHGCEVRPVLGDDFALSPCHRRFGSAAAGDATPIFVGLHFTLDLGPKIPTAVRAIEEALRPLAARPHWGKLFHLSGSELLESYGPALHKDCFEFWTTVLEWDPTGKFRNKVFDGVAQNSRWHRLCDFK